MAFSCLEFHVAGLCKPFLMAHIYVDICSVRRAFCLIEGDLKLYQTQKVMSVWKSGNLNPVRFPHILKKIFFTVQFLCPRPVCSFAVISAMFLKHLVYKTLERRYIL